MKRALLAPIIILAGLAIFSWSSHSSALPPGQNQYISGVTPGLVAVQAYMLPVANSSYLSVRDRAVSDPVLDANAAVVYDTETGQYLYEKNIDTKVPIASLTKLLSALVVQDHFTNEEIVTVASSSIRVDGQKQTLYDGERIRVRDLVSMMLVESSNDAAYALAAYARSLGIDFVFEMNKKAKSIGMEECMFTDPAGLDDNAYCTARNLVVLVRSALRQAPALWPIMAQQQLTVTSADGRLTHQLKTTNDLLGQMPGIIGGKTGNTDGALGCLILVVNIPGKDDTLINIVLGSRSRFGDAKALVEWTGNAYHFHD
jgi:D-alanyl-D-alanine carboxypeptidase (penicillin-binding protein 5/6)